MDPVLEPNLGKEIKSLKAEIRQLRSYLTYLVKSSDDATLRMGVSPGGGLGVQVDDPNGDVAAWIGTIGTNSGVVRGIVANAENGSNIFGVSDTNGLVQPTLTLPAHRPLDNYIPVSSDTFQPVFSFNVWQLVHKGFLWAAYVGADAGTDGELKIETSAGTSTSTHSLTAGTLDIVTCNWLHGVALGTTNATFTVFARRSSGTGNINVYEPLNSDLCFREDATTDGF